MSELHLIEHLIDTSSEDFELWDRNMTGET